MSPPIADGSKTPSHDRQAHHLPRVLSLDRVQLDLGVTLRAIVLTTIPDSTSQKFLVFGTLGREDADAEGRYATVFLDFLPLQNRKCTDKDMERWYARPQEDKQCLLGHKVGPSS